MNKIPKEVEIITNDVIRIKHYFNQFKSLFSKNEVRIRLLNETASYLFRTYQDLLWHEMVIGICKLTDPAKQSNSKEKNLTINYLPILAEENSWVFKVELENQIQNANEKSKSIRKWRNKLIAHRDYSIALNESKLDTLSIKKIEDVLSSIGVAINIIYSQLNDSEQSWDLISGNDSEALIHHLKNAMIYKEFLMEERDIHKKREREQKSIFNNA